MKTSMIARNVAGVVFAAAMALVSVPGQAQTVDEEAAKALFKRNDCAKCHHATREKKGAALAKVAEKYKGKADGPDKLFKHLTSSPKVKMLDDGKEEEHKIIDTKDEKQIRNLIAWILSTK